MKHTVVQDVCPACGSSDLVASFTATDHMVSGEQFPIMMCRSCTLRFTREVPCETAIGRYYQANAYVSHTDTKEGIINRLYHLARSFTLLRKVAMVKRYTKRGVGMHMDFGSGTGAFVNAMSRAGWNSIGLEPDAQARQLAIKQYNADVYAADELNRLPEQTYDAITMWHVLEHLHQLHATIDRLKQVLTDRGKLFIAVPNYTSYDATVYGAGWAAYDVPRHLYHFSPAAMRKLLQQHGLQLVTIQPMWLDSFYVCMLSEQYRKGSLLRAIWMGARSNLAALFNRERCSSLVYVAEKTDA